MLKFIFCCFLLISVILLFASPSDSVPILEGFSGNFKNITSQTIVRNVDEKPELIPKNHVAIHSESSENEQSISLHEDAREKRMSIVNHEQENLELESMQSKKLKSEKVSIADFGSTLQYNSDGLAKSSQFTSYEDFDEKYQANIAFFIQASESNLPLIPRLVDRLWHEDNIIVIHIDAKVSTESVNNFHIRYKGIEKYSNVHFLSREPITYMGISMIVNTLNAIEFLLSHDQNWDYFINISGADYPCVSAKNMRIILGQPRVLHQGVSFVQLAPSDQFWDRIKKFRFDVQYADPALALQPGSVTDTNLIPTFTSNPLRDKLGIKFVQHEAWITGHRRFVREAARGSYARKLLLLLSSSKDPEEHFFGMLGWNSPNLNKTMAHYAGRGVYWNINGVKSGQHPYTVDTGRDKDGNYEFWPRIKASEKFFIRKFSRPDSPLMDLIDKYKIGYGDKISQISVENSFKKLLQKTMCQADIENNWYQQNIVPCFKNGNKLVQVK